MKINMRQDFSNRNSSFIFLLREYVQGFQRSRIKKLENEERYEDH